MHGLKSAILAIFQKLPGWPCPVIATLRNGSLKKDDLCILIIFFFNMKPLSETVPRLCVIQVQIQQCERRLVNSLNTLCQFHKDTLATRAHFFLPLQIHQGQGQSTARHDRLTAF